HLCRLPATRKTAGCSTVRRSSTRELRAGLRRSRWLEHLYTHCTQVFAASFDREKICQIHLRARRCDTFHGERRSRARGDNRVVIACSCSSPPEHSNAFSLDEMTKH